MDCQWQPDYQYLQTLAVKDRVLFLKNFYVKVFKKIMICAQSKNFKMLVMSLVGGGFFSQLFNQATNFDFRLTKTNISGEDSFFEVVWKPTFKKAVRKYCYTNSKLEIRTMGAAGKFPEYPDIGFFPNNISQVFCTFCITPHDCTCLINKPTTFSYPLGVLKTTHRPTFLNP